MLGVDIGPGKEGVSIVVDTVEAAVTVFDTADTVDMRRRTDFAVFGAEVAAAEAAAWSVAAFGETAIRAV